MKKIATLLLALLCALSLAVFAACGETTPDPDNTNPSGNGSTQTTDKTITGVTFTNETHVYDGSEFALTVKGELPEGVSASYTNNKGTNAGTYEAQAVLSGAGYQTLTLKATLTITKATITGITFEDATFNSDGKPHSLAVAGEIPEGVSVTYKNNGQTDAGTYTVTATLSGANYETLTLTATLKITPNLSDAAKLILDRFGRTPDVWEFLPESFRLTAERAYTGNTNIDLAQGISLSGIPATGIGKQLDVIYGTVIETQELFGYVNTFYGSINAIGGLYQQFINDNPDNYKVFDGQTENGAIIFRIELTETTYSLFAKIGPASLELFSNLENEGYTGRIQLTDSNALKFVVGKNSLKIGLNILNVALTQLEFVRQDNIVTGYLYESLGAEIKDQHREITTSAILTWAEDYVTVAGKNGDFYLGATGRVVEIYRASDGAYLGAKVQETTKISLVNVTFDTYWFPLSELKGIQNVRTEDNSFYLNGSSAPFETKNVGGLSAKTASRRYDIELKTFYFYVYQNEKFEKISMELPMIFVQEENIDTLTADIQEKNPALGTLQFTKPVFLSALDTAYTTQLPLYEEIMDLVNAERIIEFVGTKNKYFD